MKYLLYPIKLLLRNKVKKYKSLLPEMESLQKLLIVKSRGSGMTDSIATLGLKNNYLIFKYEQFINKWDISLKTNLK